MLPRNSVSYYTFQQEITKRMYAYSWNHTSHIRVWTYTDAYTVSKKQFLNVQPDEIYSHNRYRRGHAVA
jgi:hypothetical protein